MGTGGKSHYPISDPIANSEVHNDDTYGVLKLALRPKGYEWRFLPVGARRSRTPEAPDATSGHR